MDLKIDVQGAISLGNRKFTVCPIFQCFHNPRWVYEEPWHSFYVSFQVIKTALCNGKIISLHQCCISLWGLLSVMQALAFIFGYICSAKNCFLNQIFNQTWAVLQMPPAPRPPQAISHCLRLHCRTFIKVLSMLLFGGGGSLFCQNSWFFHSFEYY